MTDPPTVLSPDEIAAILGVHRNTVWRWLATGKLPGRKVGNVWLISAAALQAWLDHATEASGRSRDPLAATTGHVRPPSG